MFGKNCDKEVKKNGNKKAVIVAGAAVIGVFAAALIVPGITGEAQKADLYPVKISQQIGSDEFELTGVYDRKWSGLEASFANADNSINIKMKFDENGKQIYQNDYYKRMAMLSTTKTKYNSAGIVVELDTTSDMDMNGEKKITEKIKLDSDGHPESSVMYSDGEKVQTGEIETDRQGNIIKKTVCDLDGSPIFVETDGYDDNGNLIRQQLHNAANSDDSRDSVMEFEYASYDEIMKGYMRNS